MTEPAGAARPVLPGPDDVRLAAERIRGRVHRTPIAVSRELDAELGARVFFKCENLQRVGAFKARGATNAVLALDEDLAARGVLTHSSGNHGAALAYAARARGVPCTVVMPDSAPAIKVENVRRHGAEIVFCPRGEREATSERLLRERPRTFVHPYENANVIAGQGTAALELLEDVPGLDLVIAPVGGGGLLSGTAIAVHGIAAGAEVRGAEPEAVDDARRSLESGELQPAVREASSVCDGLLTGLGRLAFDVLRGHAVRVTTVSEAEVLAAARWILERMKLVVEPSGAIVLAALRREAAALRGRTIGAILSGGNTDFAWLR